MESVSRGTVLYGPALHIESYPAVNVCMRSRSEKEAVENIFS